MVNEKRHTRDMHISHRNRLYGLPCYDIDMVYYSPNTDDPCIMTSWKHGNSKCYDKNTKENIRLVKLANKASLPLILVFYYYSDNNNEIINDVDYGKKDICHAQYNVYPLNNYAKRIINQLTFMSEKQFCEMLHDECGGLMPRNLCSTHIYVKSNGYNIGNPSII